MAYTDQRTLWVLLLNLKTLWVLLLNTNFYFPAKNFYSHEVDAGGLLHRKLPANPPQKNDVSFASKFENIVAFASKQKSSRQNLYSHEGDAGGLLHRWLIFFFFEYIEPIYFFSIFGGSELRFLNFFPGR